MKFKLFFQLRKLNVRNRNCMFSNDTNEHIWETLDEAIAWHMITTADRHSRSEISTPINYLN